MLMIARAKMAPWKSRYDRAKSVGTVGISLWRGGWVWLTVRPKTPLRVLCIVAFDTIYTLRQGQRISLQKLRILAALIEFSACANAILDQKVHCPRAYRRTRRRLDAAGMQSAVNEFLEDLRRLELNRPIPGGDSGQFQKILIYRESVARLSLEMLAKATWGQERCGEGIHGTDWEADLTILFRIVMQCQIMDDVFDYPEDLAAGLPSFLTATWFLPEAIELTRRAALSYADRRVEQAGGAFYFLRWALIGVSICTKMVMVLGGWRLRILGSPQMSGR